MRPVPGDTKAFSAVPRVIHWSSDFFGTNLLSDGTPLENSPDSFTFSLGASAVPLNPDLSNLPDWAAGWQAPDTTTYNKADRQFADTAVLVDNATFAAVQQGYVWAYNHVTLDSTSEWMIVADPIWTFGGVDDTFHEETWSIGAAVPAAARLGAINDPGFAYHMRLSSAPVAVPEPSAGGFALVAGVAAAWGRRRTLKKSPG